jgi:hypothetical protein
MNDYYPSTSNRLTNRWKFKAQSNPGLDGTLNGHLKAHRFCGISGHLFRLVKLSSSFFEEDNSFFVTPYSIGVAFFR